MRAVQGHIVQSVPFEGLQRTANLIEFDGPLLSHFKDKYNNDFLFYWVDQDEVNNRWLVWKVPLDFLYMYLSGEIPLIDLFPKTGEQLYVVDIDNKINYSQVVITYPDLLYANYLPEPESYFRFEVPNAYEDYIKTKDYLEALREKAVYVNVRTSTDRYGKTVGIQDIWDVLQNLGKSFAAFVDYHVKTILSERITDANRITQAARSLANYNRLRVVYLNLNSFHVGIAAESLNIDHQVMDPAVDAFGNKAMQTFQNDILDNDFSSTEDINILTQKYPDEEIRKKIFDPIVKIINNDNIKVNIANYTKEFDRTYARVPKVEQTVLIPRKPKTAVPDQPDQALMVAYFVADKTPEQGTLFPAKDIAQRLVTPPKEITSFPFEITGLLTQRGETVNFSRAIEIEAQFEHGQFILEYQPLSIIISVNNKGKLQEMFNAEIANLYEGYLRGDLTFKAFFDELIS